MNYIAYLRVAVDAEDSSATLYWLFEMLFRSVKARLEILGCYTASHYETQTTGLRVLLEQKLILPEDAKLYVSLREMFRLSEYANKQYMWTDVEPLIEPVMQMCSKLSAY